jgi:hypothetical protein
MSWFSESWKYRIPFSMLNPTAGTSRDGTITMPTDFGKFWDNVQSDFDDVRVTEADGITPLAFQIANGNYANRAATIQIDNYDWSAKSWGKRSRQQSYDLKR